jgi:hypothetical protein
MALKKRNPSYTRISNYSKGEDEEEGEYVREKWKKGETEEGVAEEAGGDLSF